MDSRSIGLSALLAAAALTGCVELRDAARTDADTSRVVEPAGTSPAGEARLERAARHAVALLRGALPLDSVPTADSVVLRLAPEGGGHEARVPRAALRSPSGWVVRAGRSRYSLVPPPEYTESSARVGRHFNCLESELATRAPAWASAPHVGVRLAAPGGAESCLQTWNATFVFDTSAAGGEPRLVGVLYDQWEW